MRKQRFSFALAPIEAVDRASNIFCRRDVRSMKRVDGFDEYAINVKENGIKGGGKLEVRSLPDNRSVHKN